MSKSTTDRTGFELWISIVSRILMDHGHAPLDRDDIESIRPLFDEGCPPSEAAEDYMKEY